MDIQSALVTSLKEFYSVDQIRAFWKQAADALFSRVTTAVTITGTTYEGSSSQGIVLNTPDEMANFISACQAAIKQITGDTTTDPSNLGTGVSFGGRFLQV